MNACLVHQPYLARRSRTRGKDERIPGGRIAALHIDAQSADAGDVIVGDSPILTRPAVAGYIEDGRALNRGAALDIKTKPAYPGNLAIAENPLLISPGIAGLDTQWGARDRIAVIFDVHTLIGIAARNLPGGCAG